MTYSVKWGHGCFIPEDLDMGHPTQDQILNPMVKHDTNVKIGNNAIIRSGTVIYTEVMIGDDFKCGHNVVIREFTKIGDNVKIGTGSVVEGCTIIGNNTNIQSMVFIPTNSRIGENVFIAPRVTFTNDKYPPTGVPALYGADVDDGAVICAGAIVLPWVKIGKNSFVAAGALVTKDVPPNMMAIGSPSRIVEKPNGCDQK